MSPSMDDPHYVVRMDDMPPTRLECKCGVVLEGEDCLGQMVLHVKEGNDGDADRH